MQALSVCLILVRRLVISLLLISTFLQLHAQKKWDGSAGDGLWSTPANWVDDVVPSASDDVVLDQTGFASSYTITLPPGMIAVTVRSLVIAPAAARTIEVILPATNTALPGFIATGSTYGLEIHNGGIFRNSSGASAGTPLDISDSIKIQNGGLYIHNTSRAHATNVTVLSKAPGTEQGTFEFNVPGGSGYTVSIAGRVYGNMVLSAEAAGGTKSYTSTGTTTVNINGNFRINSGVNYSLNFNGAFIVHSDFIHQGNTFDISGGVHSNRISLRKNVYLSGIVTETGTGLPLIEFDGTTNQDVSVTGGITESNTVRINNPAGITLRSALSIPFKLELVNGKITTTAVNTLVINGNATCSGGSLTSFVEGPMRKIGDEHFTFPIGKQGNYAPISISGAGGSSADEFEAEYALGNPTTIFGSTIENPPIIRVSTLEYWRIERLSGTSTKKISLTVSTHSNATLLEKLVVSRWDIPGSIWSNAGNTSFAGIATGTVTSADISSFGVFTLASTVAEQNPLPVTPIVLSANKQNGNTLLTWQIDRSFSVVHFEVLRSEDNIRFAAIKTVEATPGRSEYQYRERVPGNKVYYYKIKMIEKDGSFHYSTVKSIVHRQSTPQLVVSSTVIRGSNITLRVSAPETAQLMLILVNVEGRTMRKMSTVVSNSNTDLSMDIPLLATGVYYLVGSVNGIKTNIVRMMKL